MPEGVRYGPQSGQPAPQASAGPRATPGQAGETPGQNLRPAPAGAQDQLLKMLGTGMMEVGQELASKGAGADATVLAIGQSKMAQVQRQMQGAQPQAAAPTRSGGLSSQRGVPQGVDRPVDTMTGAPPQAAGAGDRPQGAPIHP